MMNNETTPLTDVDTELDNLLERVAVKSANQYGGFEGWDDEADKQDVIGESREAIKTLIGTIAEQIIGEDEDLKNEFNELMFHFRDGKNKLRAEQRQRKAQLLSTPAPEDGSANTDPERLKDYMENTQ